MPLIIDRSVAIVESVCRIPVCPLARVSSSLLGSRLGPPQCHNLTRERPLTPCQVTDIKQNLAVMWCIQHLLGCLMGVDIHEWIIKSKLISCLCLLPEQTKWMLLFLKSCFCRNVIFSIKLLNFTKQNSRNGNPSVTLRYMKWLFEKHQSKVKHRKYIICIILHLGKISKITVSIINT